VLTHRVPPSRPLAFIERVQKTYKEERVWPNEFDNFEEALAATTAWVDDDNQELPHQCSAIGSRPTHAPRPSSHTIVQPDRQPRQGSLRPRDGTKDQQDWIVSRSNSEGGDRSMAPGVGRFVAAVVLAALVSAFTGTASASASAGSEHAATFAPSQVCSLLTPAEVQAGLGGAAVQTVWPRLEHRQRAQASRTEPIPTGRT
jgi:hypothetical protein